MPDRPPFPIPTELEPETFCLCLQIPNDPIWKTVFAGLLWMPAEWFNWQRDEDRSGRVLAHYWRELYNQIDWSTMSCCCDDNNVPLSQYTPTGEYEESDDGGVTYEPAPEHDPRNGQPRFPPYLPPGTEEAECTYADSIVQMIKTQLVDLLEDGATYQEVIGIIITVFTTLMGALSPTVIGSIVVAILGAIAVGIVQLSIPAFQAAMTSAVYNRLRCNLHDNMSVDGNFNQSNIDSIYARIGTEETGMAALFLQGFVAAAGAIGLTNAARAGLGAADASCDCGNMCGEIWSTYPSVEGYFGTIDEVGDGYIIASTLNVNTDGHYYIYLVTDDPDTCCYVNDIEYLDGTAALAWGNCGDPLLTLHTGIFTEGCVNQLQPANNTTPFTVKFTMAACP